MAQVVSLRPCVCGKPGTSREIFVADSPEDKAQFNSCDACLEISMKFLDRMRPVFATMRSVGVPGDVANETMQFLLDKIKDTDMLETTPLDVLGKANERGEVGYATPLPNSDARDDWEAVQECLDKGWLVYGYDASPDIFSVYHGQRRTVYHLTAAGRAELCGSSEPA